jgi:hypothetical protein
LSLRLLASLFAPLLGLALVAGCSIPSRAPAVPASYAARALPLGIANARFYADDDPAPMIAEATLSLERERAALRAA